MKHKITFALTSSLASMAFAAPQEVDSNSDIIKAVSAAPATSISSTSSNTAPLKIAKDAHITIIGNGLASRMPKFGDFETELQVRYPDANLTIRNMGDEANTPAFRPQPGRGYDGQYAFPGASNLVREDLKAKTGAKGFFETPDQWLTTLKTDVVIACFGFTSSFDGPGELDRFKQELDAFLKHTQAQKYNGKSAPQVALVSPTAFENLTKIQDTPDGIVENKNLALYTKAMQQVAAANNVLFVDAFTASKSWITANSSPITQDGAQLNAKGYQLFAPFLADSIFGKAPAKAAGKRKVIHAAVNEKNWVWHNYYKIPNGVHVYGRRFKPYGPQNYPDELKKAAEMTQLRDQAIWATANGKSFDLAAADAKTHKLPDVPTNFKPSGKNGDPNYKSGEDTLADFTVPEGYKIELFASETEFKNLANPVQMSFDNKGRLWVACMPSYPHWRVGDPKPTDTLIILEDTDGDGKADKETVFADDLHIPIGFEFAPEGVYVSQSDSLVLLKDTNGDDKYDEKEYVLSGFDDHDTHHAISAFCAGPSGAIYMGEGTFLHTHVDTAYGPVRGSNGGFQRYNPTKKRLERTTQLKIPNPWGIAFDDYGQNFFLHTSGTSFSWMGQSTIKPKYGRGLRAPSLLKDNKVRPTSGLEFVSSRHFPDEVQGDILINNSIGYLGTKQHSVSEDGTGYTTKYRQDLLKSENKNVRPVDLEFAPDGSLYVVDWSNVLIGHMQHNARDPHRDHVHGRVYRITYPSRPLVKPAKVAGASITELLGNLKLHEYRTRYRTRRELRGRDADKVASATKSWASKLDKNDAEYERYLLEALWVLWGANKVDETFVSNLMKAKDHKVRAAAARVVRYNVDKLSNAQELLELAAGDEHGRVRLEAINTANWLDKQSGEAILTVAKTKPIDNWIKASFENANQDITGTALEKEVDPDVVAWKKAGMNKKQMDFMKKGREIFHREAHCATCHGEDGNGLPAAGFPPIAGTKWATQDPERLIKLSLKGLMGEIEVKGKKFNGAMTPFGGLLDDNELAAVLTYVRKSFGNKASAISLSDVKKVRAATKDQIGLYTANELLKAHPHK
ncbi:MAG: glucose/arabinose dehydrogenase/mono/diheme cytochrome c family protein [Crocinitomicaceae bacterium]|jgi:glucose/arabinose dehydrogenase/mono/diheme cytochrome c family protein